MKKALFKCVAIIIMVAVSCLMWPAGNVLEAAAFSATRDDGTWLFPLSSTYYNSFSDWAGCPGNDKCVFCGVYHSGWGDSSHTGQGGHNGFDIGGCSGASVYAAASGTAYVLSYSSTKSGRGNTVIIEHPIGNGYSYYTYYQHLASFSISNQQKVSVGDVIGKVGNTGDSSGAHLHFGMVLGVSGQTVNLSLLNKLEGYGWVTSSGMSSGRILNNPASSNDAGFPTGNSAVVAPLKAHYGSVHYTFNKSKVTIGVSSSHICGQNYDASCNTCHETVEQNTYFIKNKHTGTYLHLAYDKDENKNNIHLSAFGGYPGEQYIVKSVGTNQYTLRPSCCASRLVNVASESTTNGVNVNIYNPTGHASQSWRFQKASGGFVIRSVDNPTCVLGVRDGWDVYVYTYSGATSQIWQLQNRVQYDANGGSGAPSYQLKDYGSTLTLSSTKPTRAGYTFLGWSTSSSATSATYQAGGSFTTNANTTLYAVWAVADTVPPVISDVRVTNISESGYRVSCTVTDNVGVTSVKFPSWTKENGQDDIVWHEGIIEGNTAYVDITNNGITQYYHTHIYAYDEAGNHSSHGANVFVEHSLTFHFAYTATINKSASCAFGVIRPNVSGERIIYSVSEEDTQVVLYDEYFNILASDDDSGEGYNFRLTHYMEAGKTYIVAVKYFDSQKQGDIPFFVGNKCEVTYLNTDIPTQEAFYGDELILSTEIPTKEGYTFIGWCDNWMQMEVTHQPGQCIEMKNDMTMYAMWKENEVANGDINDDGIIDMMDAFAVYSAASTGDIAEDIFQKADVNGDGVVDMMDAFAVYRIASGAM